MEGASEESREWKQVEQSELNAQDLTKTDR
jgi:hypothetical protein